MGPWIKAKVGDKQGKFVSESSGIHQPTATSEGKNQNVHSSFFLLRNLC